MSEQNETPVAVVVHSREEYEEYVATWDAATFWEAVRRGYDPAPIDWHELVEAK